MGEWRDYEDHIRATPHVNPAADLINAALSHRTKSMLAKCAADPTGAVSHRGRAMFVMESISAKLDRHRAAWISRLPDRAESESINFPLTPLVAAALEYSDTEFVMGLSRGMPIAGLICATPGLTERKKAAELSYLARKEGIRARNLGVRDRVPKSQNIELAGGIWEKTLEEAEKGGSRIRWMLQTRCSGLVLWPLVLEFRNNTARRPVRFGS